jgi:hypothetical protein
METILSSGFVASRLFAATCHCAELRSFVHRLRGQNRDAQKELILGRLVTKKAPT